MPAIFSAFLITAFESLNSFLDSLSTYSSNPPTIIAEGSIKYQEKDYQFSGTDVGKVTRKLYDILTGIQFGEDKDEYGWITKL